MIKKTVLIIEMSTSVNAGPIDSDSDHDDHICPGWPERWSEWKISVYIDMTPELFVDFLRLKEESVNSSWPPTHTYTTNPRVSQPNEISLFESLGIEFFEALFYHLSYGGKLDFKNSFNPRPTLQSQWKSQGRFNISAKCL